jgi:hypothetical protein
MRGVLLVVLVAVVLVWGAARPNADQFVYAWIDFPAVSSTVRVQDGGITSLMGWAFDCSVGVMPTNLHVYETKPDGSSREIVPVRVRPVSRPDVVAAFAPSCPTLRPSYAYVGWAFDVDSPITEIGIHVFSVQFSWPKGILDPPEYHAGTASVAVNVVP